MKVAEIFKRGVPGLREKLESRTVGIAGCGGLGSNIAVSLVRAGVGKLIIADFDRVELSNLNRQHFFIDDVGKYKVEAITPYLHGINPDVEIETIKNELTPENVLEIFAGVDLMIEAFDLAERKQWLINSWLKNKTDIPLVCGSGVAGYGRSNEMKVKRAGNLYVCGDQFSDMSEGLCGTRVLLAASLQANTAVEILMDEVKKK
jgi:sulfur carrier protein ThiS adenylyltransferase